jgi:hypothetical protein
MFIDLPPTFYIAQVYTCDVYGGGNYNECPATGSTSNSNTNSQTATSTDSNTTDSMNPDGATTTDDGTGGANTDTGTDDVTGGGSTENTPQNATAKSDGGLGWLILLGIIIAISVIGAWIILLIKRRKRNDQQLPPPNTPYNPTPGQF